MQFSKIDAMRKRRSVRTFTTEALSQEHVSDIKHYIHHTYYEMGPFGNRPTFYYSRVSNNITSKGEKIGTYGIIKNASAYLISACKNSRENIIDLGYLFEKLVIYLEHMGIGSCWLGGTFKRETFYNKFDIHSSKLVPAIMPIGYPKEARWMENTMRKMVHADDRLAWESLFFEGDLQTPLSYSNADPYVEAFEMVRKGPSASNKQPWRLVYDRATRQVHFVLAHTPNYGAKLNFDMQYLDMGIAMYHFEASLVELGHVMKWDVSMGDAMTAALALPEGHEYIATACLSPE